MEEPHLKKGSGGGAGTKLLVRVKCKICHFPGRFLDRQNFLYVCINLFTLGKQPLLERRSNKKVGS